MSDPITGDDYDGLWFFWMDHDGFLKIAIIVHHKIIKNWTMITGDDYDGLWFFLKFENS